jgi:hypothetical protein
MPMKHEYLNPTASSRSLGGATGGLVPDGFPPLRGPADGPRP